MISFQWMRNNMKMILLVTVAAFVALIFFEWGMNFTGQGRAAFWSLKIEGEPISPERFQRVLSNHLDAIREENQGKPVTQEMTAEAHRRAADDFIREYLIQQAVEEFDIKVYPQEVVREIQNNPSFRDDKGNFLHQKYQQYISDPRNTNQLLQLENSVRRGLARRKVIEHITSGSVITEEELRLYYLQQMGMVKTRHIFIKPSEYVTGTAARMEYADHIDKYTELESVQIQHILFRVPQDAGDDLIDEISDSALNVLAQIRAGLISFDKAAFLYSEDRASADQDSGIIYTYFSRYDNPFGLPLSEDDVETAFNKAEQILGEIRDGRDFADAAQEYSEDVTRVRGGDLGWSERGRFVAPFEKALWNLEKAGDVSEVVQTRFGFHIIKLTGIDGEKRRGSHILIRPTVSRRPILDRAFQMQIGDIDGPIRSPHGFHILRLNDRKPERILPFDEVEERIRVTLVNDTEIALAEKEINRISKLLNDDGDPDFISVAMKYSHGKTAAIGGDLPYFRRGNINRVNYPDYDDTETIQLLQEEVGYAYPSRGRILFALDPVIIEGVFFLSPGEISDTISAQNGFHIFQFIRRKPFDEEEFEGFRDQLYQELENKKRTEIFNLWVEKNKAKLDIKYHPSIRDYFQKEKGA